MQFPMTAEVFHVTLENFFVFACLISDYTLKFDEWIVTRPNFDGNDAAERKRWIGVLKTSMTYAVAEPLWYWIMTTVSNVSFWWLLMGSFMLVQSIPVAVVVMGQSMLDVLKCHNEICGDTKQLAKEEEGKEYGHEKSELESQSPETVVNLDDKPTQPKIDLRPCMDRHPLGAVYFWAPLIPVVTAGMSNAGLLYYTRYLSTPDSRTWFDRFPFGWIVIATLCAVVFTLSRWQNKMIHDACGRPLHAWTVPWDVTKYRLVALFLMALVRGFVRLLLSQSPLTWFNFSDGGLHLLGDVDVSDGPGTSLGSKKHAFDRIMSAVPSWVGATISLINCVCILGYAIYSRRQRRCRQRVEHSPERSEVA